MRWEFAYQQLTVYILVFCRMAGVLLFNPLLSRRNVPVRVSMALCLGLSLLLAPGLADTAVAASGTLFLVTGIGAELLVGFLWGLIFQIFYYMLFMAGDMIDTGLGFSMARIFDAGTNIQASVTGNLFNLIFILYLFVTNSHLALIRLAAASYDIVGLGGALLRQQLGLFMINLFLQAFSLTVRLTMPFLAATFTVELIMGVLMKLVPQINIFSIHFQIKIMMGLVLLFAFSVPVANFIDSYIGLMFRQMERVLTVLG